MMVCEKEITFIMIVYTLPTKETRREETQNKSQPSVRNQIKSQHAKKVKLKSMKIKI